MGVEVTCYFYGVGTEKKFEVPETVTANNLKVLMNGSKSDFFLMRIPPHKYDKTCKCYRCDDVKWWRTTTKKENYLPAIPAIPLRLDILQKNSRVKLSGGEWMIAIPENDIESWANTLGMVWAENFPRYPDWWMKRHGMIIGLRILWDHMRAKKLLDQLPVAD